MTITIHVPKTGKETDLEIVKRVTSEFDVDPAAVWSAHILRDSVDGATRVKDDDTGDFIRRK